MTIRRRFWALFGGAVLLVLMLPLLPFAPFHPTAGALHVQVYRETAISLNNTVSLENPPTLWVQVTDAEGRLVDHTNLQTVANMPTMDMGQVHFFARRVGRGLYKLPLSFSMPGPWWVRLEAQAPQYEKASRQIDFWVQEIQARHGL
jgi:nitrogen fixation protein FixH